MNGISSIFDYFKKAFRLNKSNKELYYPQIALILTQAAMVLAFGAILYGFLSDIGRVEFTSYMALGYLKSFGWWALGLVVLLGIGGLIVEAGLYNMYKALLNEETISMTTFTEGVSRFAFRFFLANLLMLLFGIVMLIPFMVIGLITLFVGFALVPIIVSIFTAMWKVSIVMEDCTVIEGLRIGFNYAKNHFKPLAAIIIIKSAFNSSTGGSGGNYSSGNDFSNIGGNNNVVDNTIEDIPFHDAYNSILPYIKTGFYILVPVITIAVIIASLVKMVFEVFFNLALFIMYSETESEARKAFADDPLAELSMEVE